MKLKQLQSNLQQFQQQLKELHQQLGIDPFKLPKLNKQIQQIRAQLQSLRQSLKNNNVILKNNDFKDQEAKVQKLIQQLKNFTIQIEQAREIIQTSPIQGMTIQELDQDIKNVKNQILKIKDLIIQATDQQIQELRTYQKKNQIQAQRCIQQYYYQEMEYQCYKIALKFRQSFILQLLNEKIQKILDRVQKFMPLRISVERRIQNQLNAGFYLQLKKENRIIPRTQLSNGQKSMLGMAIYIGVMDLKQLSLMLSDEVDSAFDPQNAALFGRLVKYFIGTNKQMLSISHRKEFAKYANAAYQIRGIALKDQKHQAKVVKIKRDKKEQDEINEELWDMMDANVEFDEFRDAQVLQIKSQDDDDDDDDHYSDQTNDIL